MSGFIRLDLEVGIGVYVCVNIISISELKLRMFEKSISNHIPFEIFPFDAPASSNILPVWWDTHYITLQYPSSMIFQPHFEPFTRQIRPFFEDVAFNSGHAKCNCASDTTTNCIFETVDVRSVVEI